MKFSIILLIFCTYYEAYAHLSIGNCISSPIIADFQLANYTGDWYEITHYPILNELNLRCIRGQYAKLNATTLKVHNGATNRIYNNSITTDGIAISFNSSRPNMLDIFIDDYYTDLPVPFNVWYTDYNSFSCVYSCKQIIPDLLRYESVWIFSRQPTMDSNLLDKLKDFYKSKGVNVEIFEKTDQTDCVYY